jgi:hypothetical protein
MPSLEVVWGVQDIMGDVFSALGDEVSSLAMRHAVT